MGRRAKDRAERRLIVFRPASLLARLQQAARAEGTDLSALLCRLAETYLKRQRRAR
jgi:hypothetical protein